MAQLSKLLLLALCSSFGVRGRETRGLLGSERPTCCSLLPARLAAVALLRAVFTARAEQRFPALWGSEIKETVVGQLRAEPRRRVPGVAALG